MSEVLRGLWGMHPGADFTARLVAGIVAATEDDPPEALARITLFLPNQRMLRRVTEVFTTGRARLLPRLRLLSDPAPDLFPVILETIPDEIQRRMELARLVRGMLTADPSLGPECATLDLAASLGALLDEMNGEGVPIEELERIDVGDMSRHWQRSMAFLSIASQYSRLAPPGPEARRRSAVSALSEAWSISPPDGPVIVAGSTGSRVGPTTQSRWAFVP